VWWMWAGNENGWEGGHSDSNKSYALKSISHK
jgi:hypothetical protein